MCRFCFEFCTVKTLFVTFLHSSYNIEPTVITQISDSIKANYDIGCSLFSLDVLKLRKGYIRDQETYFEKFCCNVKLYINFWLKNGTHLGYKHLFSTYIAIVSSFRLPTTFAYCYVVNFLNLKDSVLFYKIGSSIYSAFSLVLRFFHINWWRLDPILLEVNNNY